MEVQGLWNASDFRAVMAACLLIVAVIANIPVVFYIGNYIRHLNETMIVIECPDCGDYEKYEYSVASRMGLKVGEKLPYHCKNCTSNWVVSEVKKYDKEGQQLYG